MKKEPLWLQQTVNILFFTVFSIGAFYAVGFYKLVAVLTAITCVFLFILEAKKKSNIFLNITGSILVSIMFSIMGIQTIIENWNSEAWLIAKIGLIAMAGVFFLVSLGFLIAFTCIVYTCFKDKSENKTVKE